MNGRSCCVQYVCNVVTMLTNCRQIQWNQMKRIWFFYSLAKRLALYRNAERDREREKWIRLYGWTWALNRPNPTIYIESETFPLIPSVSIFSFFLLLVFLLFLCVSDTPCPFRLFGSFNTFYKSFGLDFLFQCFYFTGNPLFQLKTLVEIGKKIHFRWLIFLHCGHLITVDKKNEPNPKKCIDFVYNVHAKQQQNCIFTLNFAVVMLGL